MIIVLVIALAGAQPLSPASSKIAVEGYGEVSSPPDLAKLHYEVRGEGTTSDKAARSLVATDKAILASISRLDEQLVVSDSNLEIKPLRGKECKAATRYGDEDDETPMETGDCAIIGYQASKRVSIETGKVAQSGTILGLVARHGGLRAELDSFELRDDRQAKQRAIAAALAEADLKAKVVAAGSRAKLGEVLSITLDRAPMDEPFLPTFFRPPPPEPERDGPVEIDVRPSPIKTSAQVAVIYAIER